MIRVVLADDHVMLRRSLATLIDAEADLTVVGQADNGHQLIEQTREHLPDVVVTDIRMPVLDGLEATRQICRDPTTAATKVLVLSMFDLDEYVYHALRDGASGFLLKDTPPQVLLDGIRRVSIGESLLAPALLKRLIDNYVAAPPTNRPLPADTLTAREREVLTLIAKGLSNTELATALVVSPATVKTHIAHLLTKLVARDRAQLIIAAYEMGLTQPRSTARP
jgi:DNA-binding NarL/FixJ family response regulator